MFVDTSQAQGLLCFLLLPLPVKYTAEVASLVGRASDTAGTQLQASQATCCWPHALVFARTDLFDSLSRAMVTPDGQHVLCCWAEHAMRTRAMQVYACATPTVHSG